MIIMEGLLKQWPANSTPLSPLHFLDRAAKAYPDCPSVVHTAAATAHTWADTHRRCLQVASGISTLGIKPGNVVSVVSPNTPAMYELQFAVPMAGAVLNNLNTRLDARTFSNHLQHAESKLVFVDYHLYPVIQQALSLFPLGSPKPIVILIDDDVITDHDEYLGGDHDERRGRHGFVEGVYEELVESGDPGFDWVRPRSEWEPISLNYTSGTTNNPKGVVHSHRGYYLLAVDSLIQWSVPRQPTHLWTLPMFHANGWSLTWAMAAAGATNVCLRKVDAPSIYSAIGTHRVTHMCGAPVVLNMLANSPSAAPLSAPVHVLTAGSPPPAAVLRRIESLGFVVSHGYGLTETSGLIVSPGWRSHWDRLPDDERAKLKSLQGVGTISMAEVDVVDTKTGASVPKDGVTPGEVVLKGASLMLGYLKDPDGVVRSTTDSGWFRTGDVGVVHRDGYLEIKDRLKDIIISGGENISSVEVEAVLYSHPAVNEAAVVARPDEYWGETPCAFVSLKRSGQGDEDDDDDDHVVVVTEKEVVEYCRERMPHFMVPKTVVFEDELPKTATGKIQKFLLREKAKAMAGESKTSPVKS
ncbi:hypothetical protein Droror1_Dr00024693 [Drosera rotundifolia]